jgi:hypothetical protein
MRNTVAATWILISSFALNSCVALQGKSVAPPVSLADDYNQAIQIAAVRNPSWSIRLWSLGEDPMPAVATFTEYPLDTVNHYVWVSSPVQLWQLCNGKPDAVLAIQQILGLPPQANPQPGNEWHVFVFRVKRSALFRPCPGGEVPSGASGGPRCLSGRSVDPSLDNDTARFLLQQFWTAHHVSFQSEGKTSFGYPWTAMGWTYNWDPASETHVGISEFVVRKGTCAQTIQSFGPAEFCGGPRPPEPATGPIPTEAARCR